jgi:hypothetical protein
MAVSDALAWRLNSGGTADDLYKDIRTFLGASPDAATTQAAMAQYGISGEDVANATGGKSGGLLGGNILAGASWNSLNTTLGNQLTEATGQATTNVAVGGATTADTLNQLNTYLAGGGQFDPNATVYLQTGGVDFITGVDKDTVKNNINQIVKTLASQGVDVVLTGSPYAKSIDDVINNNFDPTVDKIFTDIAKENKNVALVGIQGEILQNKKLLVDALHTNAEGTAIYNQAVIDSLSQFKNEVPSSTPTAIAQVQNTNTVATTPSVITQAANVASNYSDPNKALDAVSKIIPTDLTGDVVNQAIKETKGTLTTPIKALEKTQSMADIQAAITAESIAKQRASEQTYWQKIAEKRAADEAAALANTSTTTQRVIPTTRGTVIEGDDIEAQIAGVPQVVYQTRVDPNNTANWETYNPTTGEVIDRGTFAGGGDQGLLSAAAPVIGLAASTVGLPFISGLLGGATGLTGSALAGATGATIGAGTQAVTGGSTKDILTAALLGGGGAYLGNALSNLDVPVDFTNMTPDELNDALQTNLIKDLKQTGVSTPQEFLTGQGANASNFVQESLAATNAANNLSSQGLNSSQISQLLDSVGFTPTAITDALDALTVATPVAISTPVLDSVNVTGANTSLNNVLSTIAPVAVSTPVADGSTVKVTAPKTTGMTTQEVINLVESQIAGNVGTTTNLANVQVTGDRLATTQEIANAVIATIPNITTQQAQTIAEQVIQSGRNITLNDTTTALASVVPSLVTPTTIPTQTITAKTPVNTQDIVNAFIATTPAVTSTLPTTTVIAQRPSSITDAVTAATIPLIQPSTPLTVPKVTAQTTTPAVDPLRVAQLGLTAAGLLGAGSALSSSGTPTGYDIVPVPESWKTPPKPSVAPFTQLPPINFGNRNLLMGTQWEKFLDPNYGQVPAPVQYSQPSNLSYNDLMGILGSRQGMPSASSLSINDVISGIQNQYGQVPTRTMG